MSIPKDQLTGIILSGGKSRRMGEEKGLALFNGKPLISYALNVVEQLCSTILISANDRLPEYKEFNYPVIEDEHKGIGPMGGIAACLEQSNTQLNIVLSCDVPFVKVEMYDFLLSKIDSYQAAVPKHDGFLEPLCGVYATNVLWYLNNSISEGNYKMYDFLKKVNSLPVEIDSTLPFYSASLFSNINSPKELKGGDG